MSPPPADRRAPTVLVVDDELRSLEAIRRTLDEDANVLVASGADEARRHLEREFVDVVLADQRMPGTTGVEFLKEVRGRWPDTVRIVVSGYTDSEDIIAGINDAGIYQFVGKPWQPDQLRAIVKNAIDLRRLNSESRHLELELRTSSPVMAKAVAGKRDTAKRRFGLDRLVRASGSPLDDVCALAQRIAPFDIAVLVCGESGTGKELLARALHYLSPRADRAFVVENCAALPDQLLESELFGAKRGAYTGAYEDRVGLFREADGGTIFLDEIGETSPAFQVKLLRVLQEGEVRPVGAARPERVNVRVIAATNRDLEAEVRAGRFREDLYWRLAGFTLRMPSLRDRPMDIPVIAQALLEHTSNAVGKRVPGFTSAALACMVAYRWPGNVRELANEILRMVALTAEGPLGAELLSPRVVHAASAQEEEALGVVIGAEGSLKDRLEVLEARVLKETLVRHRWNKTKAADELGLSRVGLRAKLARFGLERASAPAAGGELRASPAANARAPHRQIESREAP